MAEMNETRLQEVEQSVATLETQLRAQVARTQAGTRAVLVIGIILIAIIFGYMTWLTSRLKEYTDPKTLAMMVESQVRDQIPVVREHLETTLVSSAPDNVNEVFNNLLHRLPVLRQKAEEAVMGLVDEFANRLDAKTDEIVTQILADKKKELDPLIEAAVVKGDSSALEEALKTALEETIGPKMDEVMIRYTGWMNAIEARLDMLLQPDENLTNEQRLEREIITAILIYLDDAIAEKLNTLPAAAPAGA